MKATVFLASGLFVAFGLAAHAAPQLTSVTQLATGSAVGATGIDSLSVYGNSLWVEYGNGADSAGGGGNSTIVQYNRFNGAIQSQYTVSGLVDGLKVNPVTGMVWALQNQDGNATLTIINPTTQTVGSPLTYASPPYAYGPNGGTGRGFDDVAFLGGKVYLSYTNPASASDPILVSLDQGNTPSGMLTVTPVLTAGATGTLPDTDSLKSTPNGQLVLTAEGDGPGSGSTGLYTLIGNPGTGGQTVSNTIVNDTLGNNVVGLDDVVFPSATSGTLYGYDSATNAIYAFGVSGLDPNTAIAATNGFKDISLIDPTTGTATPFITGANIPGRSSADLVGGLEFAAVPEPGAVAMLLTGVLGLAGLRGRGRVARRD